MIIHPIEPVYNENSRILILGSFPSVVSREIMFFYGHPRNRFWRVLACAFNVSIPQTVDEKKEFLLSQGIALWDVVKSCEIIASSDSTIKNVIANDITPILRKAEISQIFTNGKTAQRYYDKYIKDKIGREAVCLPSTSPANAAYTLERLVSEWYIIKNSLSF